VRPANPFGADALAIVFISIFQSGEAQAAELCIRMQPVATVFVGGEDNAVIRASLFMLWQRGRAVPGYGV
jgi:hypothetical protein